MSNDKVVGVGGDGQSSHWEVVSRDCAVELGRKTRDKAIGHLQERLDERDMVLTTFNCSTPETEAGGVSSTVRAYLKTNHHTQTKQNKGS